MGGLVDVFTSGILAVFLFVVFMIWHDAAHPVGSPNRLPLIQAMRESMTVSAAGLIGLAASVLGGYVAAGQACHDELLNGTVSSALCLIMGVLNFGRGPNGGSWLAEVFLMLASPALGLLGGDLQLLRQRRSAPLKVT
jgi:hypothetical protein